MLNPKSSLAAMMRLPMQAGRVTWIGVRPARAAPVMPLQTVVAEAGQGLAGDRYRTSSNGARQVTLIDAAALNAIAGYLRLEALDPALARRNIVVQGLNLLALKNRRFRIGQAVLEYSGECHPCSRMESTLGTGGYNAMRGHGGITARIVQSGRIALADEVQVLDDDGESEGAGPAQASLFPDSRNGR